MCTYGASVADESSCRAADCTLAPTDGELELIRRAIYILQQGVTGSPVMPGAEANRNGRPFSTVYRLGASTVCATVSGRHVNIFRFRRFSLGLTLDWGCAISRSGSAREAHSESGGQNNE